MTRQTVVAVLVALAVVLAGCSAGDSTMAGDSDEMGTVNFYVSDQQNAIGDFEHLNVTVTRVGLHRTSRSDDAATVPETDGNESATAAAGEASNATADEPDAGGTASDDGSAEWVEYEVATTTVDLTELQGENASQLGVFNASGGTYDRVFIHVTEVEGTLNNGERVNVKLPSQTLRVNTEFTIGADEELDYVFDVSVFETGQGKYILKPVASESGAGKKITERPAARQGDERSEDERESDDAGRAADESGTRGEGGQSRSADEAEQNASRRGNVDFYVSDEKNAIGSFAHLNVTISKVGLHRAGAVDADEDGGTDGDTVSNETDTVSNETDTADDGTETEKESEGRTDWVEMDVTAAVVDLTELQGANATRISALSAPAGTYDKVFVHVSAIDATLDSGERVRVKLPSERLHINKRFTVGEGETVAFVFDITVFEAGKSGKYILKPVVDESGTGKEIDVRDGESGSADEPAELNASFVGNVTAGGNATVEATRNGSAVANATVTVDGEVVGETAADGRLTFAVSADTAVLDVVVTDGGTGAELTWTLNGGDDGTESPTTETETETTETESQTATKSETETETESQSGSEIEAESTDALRAEFVGPVSPGADATVRVTRGGAPVEAASVTARIRWSGGAKLVTTETDAGGESSFSVPEPGETVNVTVRDDGDEVELFRRVD